MAILRVRDAEGNVHDISCIKGDKGDKGDTGDAGYTPQRGVDYWTDEDKTEIVNSVLAALPDGSEVSY